MEELKEEEFQKHALLSYDQEEQLLPELKLSHGINLIDEKNRMGIPKELLSKWINYKNAIDKNIGHIKDLDIKLNKSPPLSPQTNTSRIKKSRSNKIIALRQYEYEEKPDLNILQNLKIKSAYLNPRKDHNDTEDELQRLIKKDEGETEHSNENILKPRSQSKLRSLINKDILFIKNTEYLINNENDSKAINKIDPKLLTKSRINNNLYLQHGGLLRVSNPLTIKSYSSILHKNPVVTSEGIQTKSSTISIQIKSVRKNVNSPRLMQVQSPLAKYRHSSPQNSIKRPIKSKYMFLTKQSTTRNSKFRLPQPVYQK